MCYYRAPFISFQIDFYVFSFIIKCFFTDLSAIENMISFLSCLVAAGKALAGAGAMSQHLTVCYFMPRKHDKPLNLTRFGT